MRIRKNLILAVLILTACSTINSGDMSPRSFEYKNATILNVPFFSQTDYACGPTALAEVYSYWGLSIPVEKIINEFDITAHKGALTIDLLIHAKKQGFNVRTETGTLERLKKLIESGVPVIVMLDIGFSIVQKNHFVTVVGYGRKGFYVHDGKTKNRLFPYKEFEEKWKRADHWMLVIKP